MPFVYSEVTVGMPLEMLLQLPVLTYLRMTQRKRPEIVSQCECALPCPAPEGMSSRQEKVSEMHQVRSCSVKNSYHWTYICISEGFSLYIH